ncbi:Calcium-dependent protein kinase 16 [Durusdinium trenchii]|uniref:Calcium-dependent protein kinase 16 n=1 Tax=Durusdinium trenchii TaxID=1381693 RepID=A0ABP0IPU9_9DINO
MEQIHHITDILWPPKWRTALLAVQNNSLLLLSRCLDSSVRLKPFLRKAPARAARAARSSPHEAPRFLTKLRDKSGTFSQFEVGRERLEGDLVLQNGENIFTLQLGFPFRTKLTISAAGWTRAKVGFEGDEILSSNYVEVGIQLPKARRILSH